MSTDVTYQNSECGDFDDCTPSNLSDRIISLKIPELRGQNELGFIEIGTLLEPLLKVETKNGFQHDTNVM